jgi:hypothetical protein
MTTSPNEPHDTDLESVPRSEDEEQAPEVPEDGEQTEDDVLLDPGES